ncbi:DUF6476 family protein [Acetobacteraceae bacterium KSS8]|uniref:DUF6476 family protein n=1 Tax=Endosaccharibacter trunci TaxID=2812733 RepID=A0ABT1W7J8_9PROT|nr:DUF6476 family protein [Acetobacteraceae bacterium KSS8]
MQGQKALLGLVIVMGVLILAGTVGLVGVVVHRLSAPHKAAASTLLPVPGAPEGARVTLDEPAGTQIRTVTRQTDTLLAITLTGGGPDRVLVWDLAANRRLVELSLSP